MVAQLMTGGCNLFPILQAGLHGMGKSSDIEAGFQAKAVENRNGEIFFQHNIYFKGLNLLSKETQPFKPIKLFKPLKPLFLRSKRRRR